MLVITSLNRAKESAPSPQPSSTPAAVSAVDAENDRAQGVLPSLRPDRKRPLASRCMVLDVLGKVRFATPQIPTRRGCGLESGDALAVCCAAAWSSMQSDATHVSRETCRQWWVIAAGDLALRAGGPDLRR